MLGHYFLQHTVNTFLKVSGFHGSLVTMWVMFLVGCIVSVWLMLQRSLLSPSFSKYVCSDSRDWQPSGKDRRTLLCSDCRAYCKKYGELPPVTAASNNTRGDTPYLFRPVQTDSPDESPGRMRTRTRAKEQVRYDTGLSMVL